MSGLTPKSRREEWLEFGERRELAFFRFLPYPLLALCVAFDVALRGGIDAGMAIDLALAGASVVCLLYQDRLHGDGSWVGPQESGGAWRDATIFAALVGLAAALVIRQPLYGFYSWTGYIWSWRLLRGNWRFAGIALTAFVTAISQTGAGPYRSADEILGLIAVYLVNLCVASAFSWFGWIGTEQQDRRRRELTALTEANAKLEQSLRRNAELQQELVAQAREAAVAEERRRMAREIHDTLAQGLTGIITQLQAAQRTDASQVARTHVRSAIALARESLSEARRSVHALAPEALADARLPEAIGDVARRWSELHQIPVAFTTTGAARVMRPEIEVALLRTAQEALANVAKHAEASRVGLTLSYMEDLITLDVRDDGVGFATVNGTEPRRPRRDHGGFGLDAMRQRLEGVGGTLEIESEPDGGTAISAAAPAITVGAAS